MTGSDYTKKIRLTFTLCLLFIKYILYPTIQKNLSFRKWLKCNTTSHSIKVMNDDTFNEVRNLFVRENDANNQLIKTSMVKRKSPNLKNIQNILEEDGFVYPVSI